MVKYILKIIKLIKSNIFITLIFFFVSVAIVYSILIVFNDIKYMNTPYIKGKIINIEVEISNNPDAGTYSYYKYVIQSQNVKYFSSSINQLSINDSVICRRISERSVRILFANHKKIQNKYSAEDYVSVIIVLIVIISIVYIIYNI